MNRRNFISATALGSLVLETECEAAPLTFEWNIDMADLTGTGWSATTLSFEKAPFGYVRKGAKYRFVQTQVSVSKTTRFLIQAAFQFPAYFGVFKVQNGITYSSVAQGKASPSYIWRTKTSNDAWLKVSHVNKYIDLPAGNYCFLAFDTDGLPFNACSLCVRSMMLDNMSVSEASHWKYVSTKSLTGVAKAGEELAVGPFAIVNEKTERYLLRGCVTDSKYGQTVEMLFKPQFDLWSARKKYTPTVVMNHSFHRGVLLGASGSVWYLILKNWKDPRYPTLDDPSAITFVWEKWQRV